MADENVKSIIVQPTSLPVLASNGKYYLRYRVISQTKSATSVWSPIYELTPTPIPNIIGTMSVPAQSTYTYSSDGISITVTWNIPAVLTNASFDVFARYDNASITTTDYVYIGTTLSNSFNYEIPLAYRYVTNTTSTVQLKIQVANYSKTILDSALVVESSVVSTKPTPITGGVPNSVI